MIKILHVVSSLGGGGVEMMLYNYYINIDRDKIKFDFVVHGQDIGILEEKFRAMGSNIYHVTPKKISFYKNFKEIQQVVKNGGYTFVHCHQNFSSFSTLLIAYINHIPIRIIHSHGFIANCRLNVRIRNGITRLINRGFANYFFACSIEAGKWLYGGKWAPDDNKNFILNNAIDTDKFSFDYNVRSAYRNQLEINDNFVLLQVGRFSTEKNNDFSICVLEHLLKTKNNAKLVFVGNGNTEDKIKQLAKDKKLTENVLFLGVRDDVQNIMNAADVLLFPSKNEGFGLVAIEAQATGLPVIASDKVPKATKLTNLITYLPVNNNVFRWGEEILRVNYQRRDYSEQIDEQGFSVKRQAEKYQNLIISLHKE